jgi:hypothetical protein
LNKWQTITMLWTARLHGKALNTVREIAEWLQMTLFGV